MHFINAHNFLLTMFRNTYFHTLVNDNMSYTLQLSNQQFDIMFFIKQTSR